MVVVGNDQSWYSRNAAKLIGKLKTTIPFNKSNFVNRSRKTYAWSVRQAQRVLNHTVIKGIVVLNLPTILIQFVSEIHSIGTHNCLYSEIFMEDCSILLFRVSMYIRILWLLVYGEKKKQT